MLNSIETGDDAAAKSEKKTTVKKIIKPLRRLTILEAREAEKDDRVIVRGVVTALPGVFGSQYFYINDDVSGIQIYQNKKDFPPLALGDQAEVTGAISIANGIKRIRVKNKFDIDILSTTSSASPPFRGRTQEGVYGGTTQFSLDELSNDTLGALTTITGDITEIKSNLMYLDDGTAELPIYFKKGAKIDKNKLSEGGRIEVTGILEETKIGLQLWPRGNADIKILGPSEEQLKKQTELEALNSKEIKDKYVTATAGGVTTLLLGFLARARGALLKNGFKKIALLAIGVVRRNKVG